MKQQTLKRCADCGVRGDLALLTYGSDGRLLCDECALLEAEEIEEDFECVDPMGIGSEPRVWP